MAAYNGSRHIGEQLGSILSELGAEDEIIIVNDCSTDGTAAVIEGFHDDRIRLINSPQNMGYVRTFERALSDARGEYIFLSDQDDIWIPGRVELMLAELQSVEMVASNCRHFEGPVGPFHQLRLHRRDSTKTLRNLFGVLIGYRLHWGCAMAFRKSMLRRVLPFPSHMSESHDQWIAMVGLAARSMQYMEEDTLLHRLHQQNLTPVGVRGLGKILKARGVFARNILTAFSRAC